MGRRRKPGVGWKGLSGDSQAKLKGQWAVWPCRQCEEVHTCQKVQITQTSSGVSVVGLLEVQCPLGAGDMLMNGRIKIDERSPMEWTLLIGPGSDFYVPWDRI